MINIDNNFRKWIMWDCKNIGDILYYVKDCVYFVNVFNIDIIKYFI